MFVCCNLCLPFSLLLRDCWFYLDGCRPTVLFSIKHLGVIDCNLQCCRLNSSVVSLERLPTQAHCAHTGWDTYPALLALEVLLNALWNISYVQTTIYDCKSMTIEIYLMGPLLDFSFTFSLFNLILSWGIVFIRLKLIFIVKY